MRILSLLFIIFLTQDLVFSKNLWEGNEFFISIPPFYSEQLDSAQMNIVISHEEKTKCLLKTNNKSYSFYAHSKYLSINDLFLKDIIDEGTNYGYQDLIGTYLKSGLYLQTDKDVSVWVNIKIGDKQESFNILPKQNYAKTFKIITNPTESFNGIIYPDFFQITSAHDNAMIEISFADIDIDSLNISNSGKTYKWFKDKTFQLLLNKGEYFGLNNFYLGRSLTGTKVKSDKPISIISGNWSPKFEPETNVLIESMISPEQSGTNFHIIPFSNEASNVKILAYEEETVVNIDGTEIIKLNGLSSKADESVYELTINSNKVISSNHPISVVQYPKKPAVAMVAIKPVMNYSGTYTSLRNSGEKLIVCPIDNESQLLKSFKIIIEDENNSNFEMKLLNEFNEIDSDELKYKKYGLFSVKSDVNFEIQGESITSYSIDSNGIYSDNSNTKLQVIPTSVFSDTDKNIYVLYPNPSIEFFKIDDYNGSYVIFNLFGDKVKSGYVSTKQKIRINNLPSGTYFLILDAGTIKFVKE